jgi:hypothetical protein
MNSTNAPLQTSDDFERGFGFTISGGQVTAMSETWGTHTHNITLPQNAAFAVNGSDVVETLTGSKAVTVVTFTPETANPQLYEITAVTTTITTPSTTNAHGVADGYDFTITGGVVTAEQHTHGSASHDLHAPAGAVFTATGTGVTETFVFGDNIQTVEYVQPTAGGLYAVASMSSTEIDAGGSTTELFVNYNDRKAFTIDGGGAVTAVSRVNHDGTETALTIGSHTTYAQLAPGYVQETVTYGSHTAFEVYYSGPSANGVYTEIAHGAGSSVDLTGLESQVAQLPTSSGWII